MVEEEVEVDSDLEVVEVEVDLEEDLDSLLISWALVAVCVASIICTIRQYDRKTKMGSIFTRKIGVHI